MAVCIVMCNKLGKWIFSFYIYGNWVGNVRGGTVRGGICPGGNVLHPYRAINCQVVENFKVCFVNQQNIVKAVETQLSTALTMFCWFTKHTLKFSITWQLIAL